MATSGKVIVSGILFWYPMPGVTYQFLHYLIALRRLGYDPYYVEKSGRWPHNVDSNQPSHDATPNISAVLPALKAHGFDARWAFRGAYDGGECFGLSPSQLAQLYKDCDALLNVTGAQEIREEHLCIKRRIYVETDPVASQIRVAQGDPDTIALISNHDTHFSFGENLGKPQCKVPVERFKWLPTRQPVILDLWQVDDASGPAYTTICNWHTEGKDIIYGGETYYWSKDREFLKVLDLPQQCPARFELATHVDAKTRNMLLENGWLVRDAGSVSRNLESYRSYIGLSRVSLPSPRTRISA